MSHLEENYIKFIQMLLDDEEKQQWFISLANLSENARTIEMRNMAIKMAQTNEDESIIKLVASLGNADVYESIRAVLIAELNQQS